jgi:mRNA interferase MazF
MLERGDVLLVPFPFSDLSATKRRPVLALTAPDSYGDFTGLQVTSRSGFEHSLALSPSDLVKGTLPVASYIRFDRIVTLNRSLVIKIIGQVNNRLVADAIDRLCARLRQ